ncbi:uncharacterized protein LOC132611964 [Lycium barbarum]|uniref:uncharacterized protein LOC132611964 n=1 Tax=Lycium barbarum TaxID=112863 RepID=UPI00293F1079|nr:uncharacterized protein LOC132611964 [Lycium barbarum]
MARVTEMTGASMAKDQSLGKTIVPKKQMAKAKGRSIVENVLLTQEIIVDIRLRTRTANVVMKLDMTKAYDRVSWLFLTMVLKRMGFSERLVDMSSRGVKQWDPLSPTLFILAVEVLTRNLNRLHQIPQFRGFGMPRRSLKINHLAYADDMIIFTSDDVMSLQLIMEVLRKYEKTSGQKINKEKSVVYLHHNLTGDIKVTVEVVTGIGRKDFPFTYLGCPIFYSKRRKEYYNSTLMKIMNRLQSWKGKMLSFGGRTVLIKHVLQGMSIHLLSAMNPPDSVIKQMHKMFAEFFWSNTIGGKSRHWISWIKMCIPEKEGELDLDLCMMYLWPYICSGSMEHKLGRKMLQARDLIEQHIWWQVKMGDAQFWYDNWTGLGALYYVTGNDVYDERFENVKDMVADGRWDVDKLREVLSEEIVQHVTSTIIPPHAEKRMDNPWWLLDTRGEFSVKSSWEYLRLRGLNFEGLQLQQIITKWWTLSSNDILKPIFQVIPAVVMWELWKRRNAINDDKRRSVERCIYQVFLTIQRLVLCNTDGASRGNPGRGAYGFGVRNERGDLVYAQVGYTTNTEAEALAILEAIKWCHHQHLDHIIMTDFQMVQKVLKEEWKPPWSIVG